MPTINIDGIDACEVAEGQRLVLAIEGCSVDIGHRCGGHARCTTCRVRFIDGEPQTMTRAGDWLEKHYKEDFFLYVDTWDPHEPWDAPSYYTELYMPDYDGEIVQPLYASWQESPGMTEEKVKKAHATYMGEITMVDTWIGYLLRKVQNMLKERELVLNLTLEAKKQLVDMGYEPALGARPLKRAILRSIQNPLAESILQGGDLSGGTIDVGLDGEEFTFKRVPNS